jgi:hypothetical protein
MRRTLLAAVLCLAAFLPGCDAPDKPEPAAPPPTLAPLQDRPVDQILTATQTALRSARSVRLSGKLAQRGQVMSVDMRITAGGRARGTVTRGSSTLWLIRIQDKLWLRGERFWRATLGPAVADRIGGRWVLVPERVSADASGSLAALTDLEGLAAQILAPPPGARVSKGRPVTVQGLPAVRLTDATNGGTLYVSAQGPPYPLRIAPRRVAGQPAQRLDFGEYNRSVQIAPPRNVLRL